MFHMQSNCPWEGRRLIGCRRGKSHQAKITHPPRAREGAFCRSAGLYVAFNT